MASKIPVFLTLLINALKSSMQGRAEMQVKIPNTNNQDLAALSFSIQKLSISADHTRIIFGL